MKKILFVIVGAICVCAGFSISSCKELDKIVDREKRVDIITSIIADGLSAMSTDSNTYLSGTWAYTDGSKTFDTLWISGDSVISNHFKDDEIDLYQTGGYLYYASYKQALVQYNAAYNFKTKKDVPSWSQTLIYAISKTKVSLLNMHQLTFSELDQQTGEVLGSTTYTWVSDNVTPSFAQ